MTIVQQILLVGQGLPLAPQVPNFTLESKPLYHQVAIVHDQKMKHVQHHP